MIQEDNGRNIPGLKKIFSVCFSDTDEYIDMFFEKRYSKERCICAYWDNALAGAAHLIPFTYNGKKCYMLYAVGVLPEYRNKGLFRDIIEYIKQKADKNNWGLALCPANDNIKRIYEKLGFKDTFYLKKSYFKGDKTKAKGLKELSSSQFAECRKYLGRTDIALWDKKSLEYVMSENIFCGGTNSLFEYEGKKYSVVHFLKDGIITVAETTLPKKDRQLLANELSFYYDKETVVFISGSGFYPGDVSMTYGIDHAINGYINFLLI